jgi:two-component system, cell cycle sensor histidine kinase DivJ
MRSLFAKAGGGASTASSPASGTRPETLRRKTLAANSRLVILACGLAIPFALHALAQGVLLPFIVATLGLATGFLTLALHHRGQYEQAAAGQVYGMLMTGLLLALANPAIADFGLAIALIAPVHASLLTRTPVKKRSWAALVAVVAFAAAGSVGLIAWPEVYRDEFGLLGGLCFAVAALVVAYTANRLNSAFEVYEKAQINAYRHLIEHVQDAVMRFASDGTTLFISRSAERLFGCQRYELAGSGLLDRIHVLDRPSYLTAFADANRGGLARRTEVRMRRDDPDSAAPHFVWVEVGLSPVIDPDAAGERHEVVALLRDITERRDHEDEMRKARKLAEEASNAKSRFLATIGHELRTPLNAIVGFSEMMTSGVVGDLPPQHKEYASLIQQSGRHLIEVVRMLLDMSRLEAGKFELQTEAFPPTALVEPCLQIVEPMARSRQLRLVVDVPKDLPALVADERACRQILINLLSNAIKFSNENSVVTLTMKRQGQKLNISVTDRGIGMDTDILERIGEPFFQAQDGFDRRYEGTGLGLSIVKGLVDLHEGTLHASSVPGEGTTMTVLLPINGPAIKVEETASVTPLHRDPDSQQMSQWQDEERRRAL